MLMFTPFVYLDLFGEREGPALCFFQETTEELPSGVLWKLRLALVTWPLNSGRSHLKEDFEDNETRESFIQRLPRPGAE